MCKVLNLSHSWALSSVWSHLSGLISLNRQWHCLCKYTGAAAVTAEMLHMLISSNPRQWWQTLAKGRVPTGLGSTGLLLPHLYIYWVPSSGLSHVFMTDCKSERKMKDRVFILASRVCLKEHFCLFTSLLSLAIIQPSEINWSLLVTWQDPPVWQESVSFSKSVIFLQWYITTREGKKCVCQCRTAPYLTGNFSMQTNPHSPLRNSRSYHAPQQFPLCSCTHWGRKQIGASIPVASSQGSAGRPQPERTRWCSARQKASPTPWHWAGKALR